MIEFLICANGSNRHKNHVGRRIASRRVSRSIRFTGPIQSVIGTKIGHLYGRLSQLIVVRGVCSRVRESLYRNHATVNQLWNARCQFICFHVRIAVLCQNVHSVDD